MRRRQLLASLGAVSVPGCYQTSDPPDGAPPDADFEITFERSADGDTAMLTHTGGENISASNIRVSIGDTQVYEDGEILAGYDDGADSRNEWADTVESDDQLALSNGRFLPPWRTLEIETRPAGGTFIGGRRAETPRPAMDIDITGSQIDGTSYTTLTHAQGATFEARDITVAVVGRKIFRGGALVDAVDGPATRDEWQDGIEPGDRLRFANNDVATPGDSLLVYYNWNPSNRLRRITDGTVPNSSG